MRNIMILKTNHCTVEGVLRSVCANTGKEIITLILEYPRVIHAQLLTHRVFSKNSSSSRAVPAARAIEQIRENPAKYFWTENQKGMQGTEITSEDKLHHINVLFDLAKETNIKIVEKLTDPEGLNVHKQNACRLLEPFQNIRVCLTSTEWDNWDWLRIDPDAQGEIADLAKAMHKVRTQMPRQFLEPGEWHLPFVESSRNPDTGDFEYFDSVGNVITLEQGKIISMSCTAQTSYRRLDTSLHKAEDMYGKLFSGNKVHASPSEHQATPISPMVDAGFNAEDWPEGVTHMGREYSFWSGNFNGWIQHRQLIPNHDGAKLENTFGLPSK